MTRTRRPPSLRELLATLQAEADAHGQSRRAVLAQGAAVLYRSRVEGATRRRQMVVSREGVAPGVVEMQTFAGYGYVPRDAVEAHYVAGEVYYATLTWAVPVVAMPQEELPL